TPDSLAAALDALWNDRKQAAAWGQAGRARYESLDIAWPTVIRQLLALSSIRFHLCRLPRRVSPATRLTSCPRSAAERTSLCGSIRTSAISACTSLLQCAATIPSNRVGTKSTMPTSPSITLEITTASTLHRGK